GQAPSNLGVFSLGDLRVGHMEAAVQVPEGGIPCGIELAKTANPQQVTAGEQFTWDIRIGNPNDCVLTEVKLVDTIEVTEGILYKVISQTPKADSNVDDKVLTWNDLGPIDPGGSTTVQIKMGVDKASKAGLFTDNAVATGLCGPAEGTAGAENAVKIPLEAKVRLELPKVTAVQAAVEAPLQLPVTGGEGFRLMALAMAGLGTSLFLRRAVRKHRH
ncbi:MAG: hypothetical protein ACRDY7_15360, partial [Acidimicrobiia bacterium]